MAVTNPGDNSRRENIAVPGTAALPAISARLVSVGEQAPPHVYELDGSSITLGRDPDADLCLDFAEISRHHARIGAENGLWVLEDLNSSNGTWVDGERINRRMLMEGDIVKFGSQAYRFELDEPDEPDTVIAPGPMHQVEEDATVMVPVQERPQPNAVLMSEDEKYPQLSFNLNGNVQYVGRDPSVELHIDHKKISRKHAKFFMENDQWLVEDLGSTNGIVVNGEKVERAGLVNGDMVRVGPVPFRFHDLNAPDSALVADAIIPRHGSEAQAGTMLFNDVRASEALIRAMEAGEENAVEEKVASVVESPVAAAVQPQAIASAGKKVTLAGYTIPRRQLAAVTGVVVVLLLLVVLFSGNGEREETIASSVEAVKMLAVNVEEISVPVNSQRFQAQMDDIRTVSAEVRLALSRYPDSTQLVDAQAVVLFLAFERDLNRLLHSAQVQEGMELVDRVRSRLAELKQAPDLDKKELTALREVENLVNLGEVIVRLSMFAHRFPEPGHPAANTPNSFDLQEAEQRKKEFILAKKENHLALSVNYPYFQRMVEKVDEQYLRIINRWDEMHRRLRQDRE